MPQEDLWAVLWVQYPLPKKEYKRFRIGLDVKSKGLTTISVLNNHPSHPIP